MASPAAVATFTASLASAAPACLPPISPPTTAAAPATSLLRSSSSGATASLRSPSHGAGSSGLGGTGGGLRLGHQGQWLAEPGGVGAGSLPQAGGAGGSAAALGPGVVGGGWGVVPVRAPPSPAQTTCVLQQLGLPQLFPGSPGLWKFWTETKDKDKLTPAAPPQRVERAAGGGGSGGSGSGGVGSSIVWSRLPSTLFTMFLVNYSVMVSDWWALNGRARAAVEARRGHRIIAPFPRGAATEWVGAGLGDLSELPPKLPPPGAPPPATPKFLLGDLAPKGEGLVDATGEAWDSSLLRLDGGKKRAGGGGGGSNRRRVSVPDVEGYLARAGGGGGGGVGGRWSRVSRQSRRAPAAAAAAAAAMAGVVADDDVVSGLLGVGGGGVGGGKEALGFSYSAAGLLFPYHLGVSQCLMDHNLLKENTPLAGSSAGALVCAVLAAGLTTRAAMAATKDLAKDCRTHGTAFRLGAVLRSFMENFLPEDAHVRCSGRISVAVTQVFHAPRGLLVDSFESKEDLINALITSCWVPGYLGPRPATVFRDRLCVDGGLSLFIPPTLAQETVRVCAFPASSLGMQNVGISPDLALEARPSMKELFGWALEPAEDDMLEELFEQGFQDALAWVSSQQQQQQGLVEEVGAAFAGRV